VRETVRPEQIQKLLATEASPAKQRACLQFLYESPDLCIEQFELWTESEAERIRRSKPFPEDRDGIPIFGEALDLFTGAVAHAPPALMAEGASYLLEKRRVGIVGSRQATGYGLSVTRKLVADMAGANVCVVSGGAYGIDAEAHKESLKQGIATCAVMAQGLDNDYPSGNAAIFQEMREAGVVLSQFAYGTKPRRDTFLLRNRTIAALSEVLVVIEAPMVSGSLSTAHSARAMGRPVLVVPGNVDLPGFDGSNRLIREGATLVVDGKQVLEELGLQPALPFSDSTLDEDSLTPTQRKILDMLRTAPQSTEQLSLQLGYSAQEIQLEMTMLELEERVYRDGPNWGASV
jgi:DNA processing protein